jgi:hypothetical protein
MFSASYSRRPDPAVKAAADLAYARIAGKYGGPSSVEGIYYRPFDKGGFVVSNNKAKDLGFFCGFGECPSWPAVRVDGESPLVTRTITFTVAVPPSASSVNLDFVAPSGEPGTSPCSISAGQASCPLPADARQGGYSARIRYSTPAGEGSGDYIPLSAF